MIFYKKEKIAFRKGIEMNLNQLHYFSKLAEVEHYTKAAEELKISSQAEVMQLEVLRRSLEQDFLRNMDGEWF